MADDGNRLRRMVIHRAARRELDAARRWYENQDPDCAVDFAMQVAATLRAIIEAPARWPLYRISGSQSVSTRVRRAFVRGFPYSVFYEVTEAAELRVIAIAHQARRPGYWRTRIHGG